MGNAIEKLMFRPAEVAEAIGISRTRCYELIARGDLPCVKVGGAVRVPVAALKEWITRQLNDASVGSASNG